MLRNRFMNGIPEGLCHEGREIIETITDDFCAPASWGICDVAGIEGGVTFFVSGILYDGRVDVRRNSGMYEVTIGDGDSELTRTGIRREDLTEEIYRMVGRNDLYAEEALEAYDNPLMGGYL